MVSKVSVSARFRALATVWEVAGDKLGSWEALRKTETVLETKLQYHKKIRLVTSLRNTTVVIVCNIASQDMAYLSVSYRMQWRIEGGYVWGWIPPTMQSKNSNLLANGLNISAFNSKL